MFGRKPVAPKPLRAVNDIENDIRASMAKRGKLALREAVPIVVIDDQPFEPAENLRNNHYRIEHRSDITRVEDVAGFPIVLCDLQGVGAGLHTELQGAHLIREIKTHYPEKIVIAYSGIAKTAVMAKTAQQYADEFLRKDEDMDSWIDALDTAVSRVSDPIYMWKNFRKRMLDDGMRPQQLAELEDAFVSSIWKGPEELERSVGERVGSLGLTNDLRSIVTGFIASLIFKAVVG